MKHIAKTLVLASAFAAAGAANADLIDCLSPFIGVDYYQAWMRPHRDYSAVFNRKSFPGATLYIGTRFQDCLGVELGWDWSRHKHNTFSIADGTTFFGSPVAGTVTGTSSIKRRGGHLDLIGYLPIYDCFEFFGTIGYGWVDTRVHVKNIAVSGVTGTPTLQSSAISSLHGRGRSVLRLGIGANYMLTGCVGVRAKLGWETTSSARFHGNAAARTLGYSSRGFRDSGTLSVGAFLKW